MEAALTVTLVEYETNDPDKGDYVALCAVVDRGGFRGQTVFWSSTKYLATFLAELAALDAVLTGRATLRCGWGDRALIELDLYPHDRAGRLHVDVALASDSRMVHDSRVTTSFVILPNSLSLFRRQLAEVVSRHGADSVAMLSVDPDAAV